MIKINVLLVLLVLIVSIGVVSAADDLNNESSHVLDVESGNYIVNESNYIAYFSNNGEATSNIKNGDTVNIEGNFSDKNFTFKTPVNVIGSTFNNLKNCVFTFNSEASGSNVSFLNISNTNDYYYGIFLNSASKCIIKDCFINNTGVSSYALCLGNGANNNSIINNYFNDYGLTYGHGTRSTSPLLISGSNHNYIAHNMISCDDANGIYLSSYSGGPLNGGASNFNLIYNNTVKYNVLPTSWSYGIQIMGTSNTIKSNKVIGAYRGISISGSGNIIISNEIINVTGADFNTPDKEIAGEYGIAGSYYSLIANNTIINSKILASGAGIFSLDYSTVENNTVQVIYRGVGVKPAGSNITVGNNIISTISGTGVLVDSQIFNINITGNTIECQSGNGILIQKISSKRMPGNITIVNNTISAGNSKIYAIDARDADKSTNNLIEDNYVPKGYGSVATPNGVYDASKPSYKSNGTTYIINSSNYDDYVEENGALSSQIKNGDVLIFEGEFVNKLNIIVNCAVKIIGRNALFYNTTFKIYDNTVWIENITIKNSKASKANAWGILVYQVQGATILNCNIEVTDPNAAYAVYVVESTEVDVINNTLYSSGEYLTYTLLAYNVDDCRFINNTIKTNGTGNVYINTGMEACIDGDENCLDGDENCLDGDMFKGNHVVPAEVYRTYGILMLYASNNIISGNNINATSKLNKTVNTTQSTNSIVGIDLYYNSHYNTFSNNVIYINSLDNYIYGMGVLGFKSGDDAPQGQGALNNQFINNNITLEGTYFTEGFVIGDNSFNTTVSSNIVDAKSDCVNYGVNLETSDNSFITNNKLTLTADVVYGMEIFKADNNNVSNNNIKASGKKVYGLLLSNSGNNTLYENIIIVNSTNEEITFKNFDSIQAGNAGLYIHSNSSNNIIKDNNITSNKGFSVSLDNIAQNNIIENNYLDCENGIGDDAVNNSSNNTVEYNYKYLISGLLKDINIKYFENATFEFICDDENLNGAVINFTDIDNKVFNSTFISNGTASVVYNFNGFKDYTPASYMFYANVYQKNYKLAEFSCIVNIEDGDLILSLDNVEGAVARDAKFNAKVKNILGDGVSGITVEFYAIDDGFEVYIGKALSDENGLATVNGEIPYIYSENPEIAAYIKNPYYFNSTSAKANLTAYWLTKTNISLVNNNVYPNGVVAILKDQNGTVLSDKTLTLKIGAKNYNIITNQKGEITMPVLSKGTYICSILFDGDGGYYDSKISAKITVLPSISENKDFTVYYGSTINYKIRVKDSNGKYASNKLVTIKVNGKTYNVYSNAKGYVTRSLKLNYGSYTITAQYNGDKVSNKLTVKSTLTAKNVVSKYKKSIKFSVKAVDKNGKIVKNKKIIFKIKNKKYTAKTNKKGVATAVIKNLKAGKYTITSTYNKCVIKNTIKIKK